MTLFVVNKEQLQRGMDKLVDMLEDVNTLKEFMNLAGYIDIVAAQLRVHEKHKTADMIIENAYKKFEELRKKDVS